MTTTDILRWIDQNLGPTVLKALADYRAQHPGIFYTKDMLIAMTYRETGRLIEKRLSQGFTVPGIWEQLKGDYSQRKGETEPQHHGFGPIQVDIGSFPDFIKSGEWKDPYKCYMKALQILEDKRRILENHFAKLGGEELQKAVVASFNAGEGNEIKVVSHNLDLDAYTTDHNYSADVWRLRAIYLNMDNKTTA